MTHRNYPQVTDLGVELIMSREVTSVEATVSEVKKR